MDKMCSLKSLELFFLNKHLCLLDHAGIQPDKEINNLEKNFNFSLSNNFPFTAVFNLNLPTVKLLSNLLDKSTPSQSSFKVSGCENLMPFHRQTFKLNKNSEVGKNKHLEVPANERI